MNVSSRSPPRDLWSEVTGGVYCAASVTLLCLRTVSLRPPSTTLPRPLALSFSFLPPLPPPPVPSRTFSLSHVFLVPSFHESLFALSFLLSSPSPRHLVRSFVVRCSLQVRANPPSYIQQTPSIYSFELDGSKGKVAGCCSVNFRPLKYLVSSLSLSLCPYLPSFLPLTLSVFIPCSFALIYRFEKRRVGGGWRAPVKKNR